MHLQGGPPPSEQRQRSLFGSPLLPLHNIHSGKGRTTSERRDGGPDDTPKCTDSCSRSPSPPTPKARLGFSSRAALCFLGRLTTYGAEPVHLQGGPPPSEQRQRSLFGSPLLPLYHLHSDKGRTTSERRDGGSGRHPQVHRLMLPLLLPAHTQSTIKPGLIAKPGFLFLLK